VWNNKIIDVVSGGNTNNYSLTSSDCEIFVDGQNPLSFSSNLDTVQRFRIRKSSRGTCVVTLSQPGSASVNKTVTFY
jgi:hypothetical protein